MDQSSPETVDFYKMQGCGNDFVLIDNRGLGLDPAAMPEWAKKLCRRAFGVGADGLILLDAAQGRADVDYIWHFFNADGSRAAMCGNGARCAAKLAVALGLAGPRHRFGTDAGPIEAEVFPDTGLARVELTRPGPLEENVVLDLPGGSRSASFVNTGVPHAVIFVDDASAVNVRELGAAVRFHARFAPAGTNANFVQAAGPGRLILRTYERGVEDETHACGTGACAAALAARARGLGGDDYAVRTSGGETLRVSLQGDRVFLTGAADTVFTGAFSPGALGLSGLRAGLAREGA
ncbi:MAG: diaminopimelate epimerase [Desulfovibrionaceae bacterium]|nr:diaminopimelate epimerase [Desulfovibrionaceae bacterium]MBF0512738.1 diaminopimelate epimerase [Desulfovibrionaceae bacterium]